MVACTRSQLRNDCTSVMVSGESWAGFVTAGNTPSGRIQSTALLELHVDQEPASLHTPGGLLHLLAGTQCHEHSLHRVAGIRAQHDEAASPDLRCGRGCRSQKLWAQQKFGGCSSARTGAGGRRGRQEAVDAEGAMTVIAGTKLTFRGTHLLGADCGQHLLESLRSSREGDDPQMLRSAHETSPGGKIFLPQASGAARQLPSAASWEITASVSVSHAC